MRAVVVAPGPDFSVQDVYRGWCTGLREIGVDVVEFNLNDRLGFFTEIQLERGGELRRAFDLPGAVEATFEGLQSVLYRAWPDFIVCVSGFFTDGRLLDDIRRTRPHKLVMIHTESPYEDDRQVSLSEHFDVNIVNDPQNLDRYPNGTLYVPHAYDPKVHHPDGRGDEWDFSFVGTGYPSRIDYLESVDFGDARVGIGGNWPNLSDDSPLRPHLLNEPGECIDNTETAEIYRSSTMSANLYRVEAERPELSTGWAMGPREVELAACGTFFTRDPRGEGDEVFPMLPKVTDPRELSQIIAWSMSHPDERQAAADLARAAISDRTFESNARRLMAALGV